MRVPVPVTAKIRKGYSRDSVNAVEVARACEAGGADAVTVHGRTRDQMYAPPVDWEIIRQVKQALSIPVIGNGDVTSAAACADPDARAKPIIAEAVSVFGKVVLILLKIFAGFLVFGLIMGACALIIGLFAVIVGGESLFAPEILGNTVSIWVASLGILAVLIPLILLIYVLMCLIASRKPGGKTVLAIFLVWLATIIAVSCVAIRENVGDKFRKKRDAIEQVFRSEIVIDGDTTTLERLLEDYDDESVIEEGRKTLHIAVPSKSIDITVDKNRGSLHVNADGREVSVQAGEKDGKASVSISAGEKTGSAAEAAE